RAALRDGRDGNLGVGLGQLRVEPLECGDEDLRDGEVARPVVVGRHDVPRRVLRRRLAQRVLVRFGEVVPQRTVVEIAGAELPALFGLIEPLLQPFALFVARHVEKHLDDGGAFVPEHLLERANVLVAALPYLLLRKLAYPYRDDVLVVRAVEDPDLAARGAGLVDTPEIVVCE